MPDTPHYLTLQEIAENLGVAYYRLYGFAKQKEVQRLVGAVDVAGVKGVRYTEQSQQLFAHLIAEQDAGRVEPSTAAAVLAATTQEPFVNVANVQSATSQIPSAELLQQFASAFLHVANALQSHENALRALPAPEDMLLTAEQVHAYIPRGTDWLRNNVPSVKIGRARFWKRSAVLAFVANLPETQMPQKKV